MVWEASIIFHFFNALFWEMIFWTWYKRVIVVMLNILHNASWCFIHNFQCAIDGGYTQWVTVGSCSETCGTGRQTRQRTCTNPAPQFGGADCSSLGLAIETTFLCETGVEVSNSVPRISKSLFLQWDCCKSEEITEWSCIKKFSWKFLNFVN